MLVTVGLAFAMPRSAAANACRPDISVGDTVHDRERVLTRAQEAICTTLHQHDIDLAELPSGRRLVADVRGVQSQWTVSVAVEQDGAPLPGARAATCRCTDETMLAELSKATIAVVPLLVREAEATQEPAPDRDAIAPLPSPSAGRPAPLGTMGNTGVGLLAAGTAGSVIGIALVVSGSRVNGRVEREGNDLRPAGYALLGTSLALGITGAVLLGVDRRRARRVQAIAPTIGPGMVGLTAVGRF